MGYPGGSPGRLCQKGPEKTFPQLWVRMLTDIFLGMKTLDEAMRWEVFSLSSCALGMWGDLFLGGGVNGCVVEALVCNGLSFCAQLCVGLV